MEPQDIDFDNHTKQLELNQLVSNCCGEPIVPDTTDICSHCYEHSDVLTIKEWMFLEQASIHEESK